MKDCNQCGKCCTNYSNGGLSASQEEIDFWEDYKPHIASYVRDGKIWIDPSTGEQIERCPWLRAEPGSKKFTCDIYDDRPEDCRHYPVTIEQMIKDDCEMLEPRDLRRPKQAQISLDRLMAGSRPPVER